MSELKYIKAIDGLRAIAVIGVMASHFGIYRSGWLGVQLFFVISGYLIISILLKEKASVNPVSYLLKRFYYRRSLRIFPLYYFYLFILLLVYKFYYNNLDDILDKLPYLSSYTYNLTRLNADFHYSNLVNHLWSLCVEEQFYLVFPFIVFFFNVKNLKYIFLILIFLTPFLRYLTYIYAKNKGLDDFGAGDATYIFTSSHLDAFVTGGVLTLFNVDKLIKASWAFIGCALVFFVFGFVNSYLLNENYFVHLGFGIIGVKNYQHIWSYTVANFFFASVILLLISKQTSRIKNAITYILSTKAFIAVGRVSYGMYIYHWLILFIYFRYVKLPLIFGFILYSLIVYVVSVCSFNLFELKFINLKDRYFKLNF